MDYIFDYQEIKKFISAEKEEDLTIMTLTQGSWALLKKMIGRQVYYQQYSETHKVNKDLKIFVNEPPIDTTKDISIFLLDKYYTPLSEITNYNIAPESNMVIVPPFSPDIAPFQNLIFGSMLYENSGQDMYSLNAKFYNSELMFKITYWGGFKEFPNDLKIALYNIIKFFYVNRDPSITKINSQQLVKSLSDFNPQVMRIVNSWRMVKI